MSEFRKLFEPIKIGNVELKNRIVFLATQTLFTPEGHINDRLINYYEARAKGGCGLVIAGIVLPFDWSTLSVIRLYNDSYMPEFKRLVDAIHKYNTPAFAQVGLEHLWRRSPSDPVEAYGPSGVAIISSRPVQIMTIPEIQKLEDEHAETILRCKKVGFDGVEVHAGTGFIVNQFISTFTNKRTDEYGGSIENRLRLLSNIVKKTRQKVEA